MGLFSRTKWEDKGSPILADEIRNIWSIYNPNFIDIRDNKFRALPRKDFEYMLAMFREPEPNYNLEKYDCDDFATSCMRDLHLAWNDKADTNEALAFGYVSGVIEKEEEGMKIYSKHAWIWQMTDTRDLVFYDPQTNKRMKYRVVSVDLVTT